MTSPVVAAPSDWLAEYPPPRSLPLDQEAIRIYERAYHLGRETEGTGNPRITFTTVLAALLAGTDDTSVWFRQRSLALGPQAEAVFGEKKIDQPMLDRTAPMGPPPPPPELSTDKQLLTVSARTILENAERWAQQVGGSDIGVRHLVASYVLNPPPDHRAQMVRWSFQEPEWRVQFFEWASKSYLWEAWSDTRHRPAPARTVHAYEQQKVKGKDIDFKGSAPADAVLKTAGEFHARRQDQWLRIQTMLFALVETARADAGVRSAITPLWHAAQEAGKKYESARDAFVPGTASAAANVIPFDELDISPRVLNVLETARELVAAGLARTGHGVIQVGALHLAGSLVSRRVDSDNELAAAGLDPEKLRADFVDHAQATESGEVWREVLGVEDIPPSSRPVDLNSDDPEAVVRLDEPWKNDPLAIRSDVESFASLLASKTLEPPLSIGLFGPWGSGKTTFLKRLRRAVDRRANDARSVPAGSPPSPYVPNVVHVEFNAWHFAEDALISSLVDAILRELSGYIKDDQVVAGRKWAEQKRHALVTTERRVEAAQAVETAAKEAVAGAEQGLAAASQDASRALTGWRAALGSVWTAARSALQQSKVVRDSRVLESVGATATTTDELRSRLAAVRARPARLLQDLGWPASLVFAALVIGVPLLVDWGVRRLEAGHAAQLLSTVAAMGSVVGLWLRSASQAVSRMDTAVAAVADEYEKRLAADPGVLAAQAGLDAARASADTAAAGLQAARDELARAQADVANAALPVQMLNLVSARLADLSYGKELTTLSLARADLAALSQLLRKPGDGPDDSTPGPRAVDRVILYIDDLDRCKPRDVVRVLQLVHMLLAFELFVVVVAVDARWVEVALRTSYKWLVATAAPDGGVAVTPQDYLEKIFQISFWLEPMRGAQAAPYLASLVRTSDREAGPVFSAGGERVGIAAIELDYMRALAAYVGPSPRRVKRLVNAYRLIKARMPDAQLEAFLADQQSEGGLRSGPYQTVIGLLVIGTGAPSSGALVLRELAEWDPTDPCEKVVAEFRNRDHPDWNMAAKVIETIIRTQKPKDMRELRGWARKVSRFLLHSHVGDAGP